MSTFTYSVSCNDLDFEVTIDRDGCFESATVDGNEVDLCGLYSKRLGGHIVPFTEVLADMAYAKLQDDGGADYLDREMYLENRMDDDRMSAD